MKYRHIIVPVTQKWSYATRNKLESIRSINNLSLRDESSSNTLNNSVNNGLPEGNFLI